MDPLPLPVSLIECPRDAMQGWKTFIPTLKKTEYLNALLKVGFDTLDFGSFVSPKAVPQMADTREVLAGLQPGTSGTRLLAIVANRRGAEEACAFEQIDFLGFPFSVSETFQQRNTHSTMEESLATVKDIHALCKSSGKQLVVYLSMAFGNPYHDPYNPAMVLEWAKEMVSLGISTISIADTVGLASPEDVFTLTSLLIENLPGIETGVHLHAAPAGSIAKLEAAFRAGCRRFDGALKGIGGCPMAGDDLVGNLDSVSTIRYFESKNLLKPLNREALQESLRLAGEIFSMS
jgi:hydroxymethylglutaryl-CoA lyase